jgi:cytochrome bd-type quinol oxidase subunit 2
MNNEGIMHRKHSLFGIGSILLSIPFYIIVRLLYTTEHLDKFIQQNFILVTLAIFLVLPALTTGFTVAAFKQKGRNKLFAYLGAIVSAPVLIFSIYRLAISIAYIMIAVLNR